MESINEIIIAGFMVIVGVMGWQTKMILGLRNRLERIVVLIYGDQNVEEGLRFSLISEIVNISKRLDRLEENLLRAINGVGEREAERRRRERGKRGKKGREEEEEG